MTARKGKKAPRRIVLDIGEPALAEALSCVARRVLWYRARNLEVPHLTAVTFNVLHAALGHP